ncbi:zinc finger domain-containing protein [Hamiltosporidium magnivora]|uniref:Zinc finger domain-containing protein n=1 Tax=Hamiltosporidium magnivora TaxID=148818 RepID=A0A4Q9LEK9_9MICR|nr:zinc finger domain-containing protein [Hamiltosporidium magnivora]TBU06686.1 zinc finger domain-containing protein [Hamiltosporidium magnivora]TBU09435.1 zinc finger domain-containing protein [Hamiltosporidium magnivora]
MEDCYYFLYSSCSRNGSCVYRHSQVAKENPVLCKNWDNKGICFKDCPFRHSRYHLSKNRKDILCYWESQPEGCTKEFCEFRHLNVYKDSWKDVRVKSLEEIRQEKIERQNLLKNAGKNNYELSFEKLKISESMSASQPNILSQFKSETTNSLFPEENKNKFSFFDRKDTKSTENLFGYNTHENVRKC